MFEDVSPTDSPPILSCLVAKTRPTLSDPMDCTTPGSSVLHRLPEFDQTHVPRVGDAVQPSHSLSPLSPPTFSLSQHQGLSQRVNSLDQVAKVLELQLQHQSFQWRFGLISFGIDWFYLLVVQGTLRRLLQHHNLKASIFWHSAFFMVHLSHPYMTTGKTIALTRPTFVSKVMFLLFCSLLGVYFLIVIYRGLGREERERFVLSMPPRI